MAIYNGRIPTALLRSVKTQPSMKLRSGAARSLDKVIAEVKKTYGWTPRLNDAYRSISRQGSFIYRYYQRSYRPGMTVSNGGLRYYRGVRWYRKPGMPTAATPGYSNHGLGVAIDVNGLGGFSGTRYKQFSRIARKHGWSNSEGARLGEAWHWVFTGNAGGSSGGSSRAKRRPHRIATIKRGKRTNGAWRVRLWQRFLNEANGARLKVDGKFGNKTRSATKTWQRKAGLVADGVVGKRTWFRSCLGVDPGDRGVRVKIAQRVLGLTGKAVDGVAGKIYTARAKEMQRWLGVKADAKIGPKTVSAMLRKG